MRHETRCCFITVSKISRKEWWTCFTHDLCVCPIGFLLSQNSSRWARSVFTCPYSRKRCSQIIRAASLGAISWNISRLDTGSLEWYIYNSAGTLSKRSILKLISFLQCGGWCPHLMTITGTTSVLKKRIFILLHEYQQRHILVLLVLSESVTPCKSESWWNC